MSAHTQHHECTIKTYDGQQLRVDLLDLSQDGGRISSLEEDTLGLLMKGRLIIKKEKKSRGAMSFKLTCGMCLRLTLRYAGGMYLLSEYYG